MSPSFSVPVIERPSLRAWQRGSFRFLWGGQAAGLFGYQVAGVILPLFAVSALHASPSQVGLLVTCEFIGFLLIGLPAGSWVDKHRTDRVLLVSSLIRGLVILAIPVVAVLGVPSMGLLYAVTFAASICTVFFGVAYQSIVPQIIGRADLTRANARLESTRSIAEIGGPAVAGLMMTLMPAAYGLLVTSLCFLASTLLFNRLRVPPNAVKSGRSQRGLLPEVWEGLAFVMRHRVFRAMAVRSSTYNFCNIATTTMFLLLLATDLRLSSAVIGVVFAGAGLGAAVAAAAAPRLARRFGAGNAILGACVAAGAVSIALPFTEDGGLSIFLAATAHAVASGAIVVSNILQVTIRQTLCPPELLGRMNATMRFIVWGVVPVGASVAGILAGPVGVRGVLAMAVLGEILSVVPLLLSSLRGLTLSESQDI